MTNDQKKVRAFLQHLKACTAGQKGVVTVICGEHGWPRMTAPQAHLFATMDDPYFDEVIIFVTKSRDVPITFTIGRNVQEVFDHYLLVLAILLKSDAITEDAAEESLIELRAKVLEHEGVSLQGEIPCPEEMAHLEDTRPLKFIQLD